MSATNAGNQEMIHGEPLRLAIPLSAQVQNRNSRHIGLRSDMSSSERLQTVQRPKRESLRPQEQGEESDAINLHLVLHRQLHPAVLVKVPMQTGLQDADHRHGAAAGVGLGSGATPAFGGLCRHKALSSLLPSLWGSLPTRPSSNSCTGRAVSIG